MKIKVTTQNGTQEVPFLQDTTVLESLEQANIPAEYHCREGFCGACRCKLTSGEVEYVIDPLAFIDDDEVLPCVIRPQSDIEIDTTR